MKYLIYAFILAFAPAIIKGQEVTNDIFDLEFKKFIKNTSKVWLIEGDNCRIKSDSASSNNNKPIALIEGQIKSIFEKNRKSNHFSVYQFIPIYNSVSNIKVTLHSKTLLYKNPKLKVICLDANEKLFSSSSSIIKSCNIWEKTTVNLNATGPGILYIQIYGEAFEKDFKEKSDKSVFWLDKISVELDGEDIYSFNKKTKDPTAHFSNPFRNVIKLPDEIQQGLENIDIFKNHPVIALGETIHGSETITESAFQIIRYLIEKENYKQVLFELPFSEVMVWNQYILGCADVDIDSLVLSSYSFYSPTVTIAFLKWLKLYNDNTQQKVNIVGTDISFGTIESINIIKFLNLFTNNTYIDSLINLLIRSNFKPPFIYARQKKDTLKLTLGDKNYASLVQALMINAKYQYRQWGLYDALEFRDTVMWQNFEFAMNNAGADKRTVIYSHWGHVNKLDNTTRPFTKSLGYYINQHYGHIYFVIGLLAGEGTCTLLNNGVIKDDNQLFTPVLNSLEYLCINNTNDRFYSLISDSLTITRLRMLGKSYPSTSQFLPFSIRKRMDAFIFTRNSNGFKIPQSWPLTSKELFEKHRKEYLMYRNLILGEEREKNVF